MANLIDNLTNFADQATVIQLPDGTTFDLELIYHGATERWIMNVYYGNKIANGIGVCCFPNLLRQWALVLPFGIACIADNQVDPFDIDDFSSGRVQLYVLTLDDIANIENVTFGATQ